MKFSRSLLWAIVLAMAPVVYAQQDGPAVNAESILRDLDKLEQQQKESTVSAKQAAINRLKSAMASGSAATGLYVDAVEAVQFEGKPNKAAAFSDWKASNGDLFRSREMQTVMQLYLRYLILSMERASSDKPEAFVAPSLAYANELFEADNLFVKKVTVNSNTERDKQEQALRKQSEGAKKEILDKSVADSVIAKWMRLSPWLPKVDDWEMSAGNLGGILEKNVRTQFRLSKDPRLTATWDMEMKLLADRITSGRLEFAAEDFNTVTRPKMIFSRANDMIILGQTNRGTTEIYQLIKANPQHPDFATWVTRLRELLKKPEAPVSEAPAATPSTSP